MGAVKLVVALFVLSVVSGRNLAGAQVVHHVVNDDRASDTSTDIGPWSSSRSFRVGDSLLFRYFSPQEIIVELASMEEYYSCDLTNPIKMYTEQESQVPLEKEGVRYFASGSYEKCKNGLKLPVQVKPREVSALGPSPSTASHLHKFPALVFIGLFFLWGVFSIIACNASFSSEYLIWPQDFSQVELCYGFRRGFCVDCMVFYVCVVDVV